MSEVSFQRVVIACDVATDIRAAVDEAAALAERWNAALHGVFLEDENLHRLAGLPFGRQVTLSTGISESFSAADLENLSSALSAAMRRALAEEAARRGLAWSFGVVRDLPGVAALAETEGDFLMVQGAARPFSGSWHPRSSWDNVSENLARTILIRRQKRAAPGTVVVLASTGADLEKVLLSGISMTDPGDEIVILVPGGSPSDLAAATQLAGALDTAHRRKLRSETAGLDTPTLLQQVNRLAPSLLALDAGDVDSQTVRDLLAATRCDVLLIR